LKVNRTPTRFYILRQGKVLSSRKWTVVEEEGGASSIRRLFGVVSTMSSHSHIETAQALTDVTLISVQKDQYGQLIQNNAPWLMKIILQFSKRMRYLDEALTRLTLKSTAETIPPTCSRSPNTYASRASDNSLLRYHQYIKILPRRPETFARRPHAEDPALRQAVYLDGKPTSSTDLPQVNDDLFRGTARESSTSSRKIREDHQDSGKQ
jgi:CRP-like cAMP-binding protein